MSAELAAAVDSVDGITIGPDTDVPEPVDATMDETFDGIDASLAPASTEAELLVEDVLVEDVLVDDALVDDALVDDALADADPVDEPDCEDETEVGIPPLVFSDEPPAEQATDLEDTRASSVPRWIAEHERERSS